MEIAAGVVLIRHNQSEIYSGHSLTVLMATGEMLGFVLYFTILLRHYLHNQLNNQQQKQLELFMSSPNLTAQQCLTMRTITNSQES